ncbi:MAG: hypothetical protein ACREQY_12940 [Candidatus Binatia bacterium]
MARNSTNQAEDRGAPAAFEPDSLLPDQFAQTFRRQKGWVEGEKRLIAAVLTDAVDCYIKYLESTDSRGRQLFEDAEAWIFDDSAGGLFPFRAVCEMLGLEPEYVRQGLIAWRRRRQHGETGEYPPLKAAG